MSIFRTGSSVTGWSIGSACARAEVAAMLDNLIVGLSAALQLKQFLFMVLGTVIGLWVGVLPGLGGPVAMAILIRSRFPWIRCPRC